MEDVAAPVVGVLPAVALLVLVAVTAIILTLILVLLHRLPRTAIPPFPLIPGLRQLQPRRALIPIQAGQALRRPKLEHGVATPIPPGVHPRQLMALQLLLLLSSRNPFLLPDRLSRLLLLPSFHGRKLPGVYSLFPRPIFNFILFAPQRPRQSTSHCPFESFPICTSSPCGPPCAPRTPSRAYTSPRAYTGT